MLTTFRFQHRIAGSDQFNVVWCGLMRQPSEVPETRRSCPKFRPAGSSFRTCLIRQEAHQIRTQPLEVPSFQNICVIENDLALNFKLFVQLQFEACQACLHSPGTSRANIYRHIHMYCCGSWPQVSLNSLGIIRFKVHLINSPSCTDIQMPCVRFQRRTTQQTIEHFLNIQMNGWHLF